MIKRIDVYQYQIIGITRSRKADILWSYSARINTFKELLEEQRLVIWI